MAELHVCILGAGALGQAYALTCARGGARVTLVGRAHQATQRGVQGQRLTFPRRHETAEAEWVTALPHDSDVILVCVRMDQVNDSLLSDLAEAAGPSTAVVFVTPLPPRMAEHVRSKLPHGQSAMPSLIAEFSGGEVAYWVAPTATLFSVDESSRPSVTRLIEVLKRGGVPSRIKAELRAHADATTIAFFPIQLGFLREPKMSAWRSVPGLVPALASALGRTLALAKRIGQGDRGLMLLMWLLSTTWILALTSALLPRIMPRFATYLGKHFGEKLRAQHVALYAEVTELGAKHRVPLDYDSLIVPTAQATG